MRIPLPPALAERATVPIDQPAPLRDAATIALVRSGPTGAQTYLLRRQPSMDFAPGQYVFPGGKVQDSDHEDISWLGPPAERWAERFDCSPQVAKALVVAAVRETFEESGILLAGPDQASVADTNQDWVLQARLDLEAGELGLAELFDRRALLLRSDLLAAWSHWITPEFEPRRYDTRFFVAVAPEDQVSGTLPSEADRAEWVDLSGIAEAVAAGKAAMLPPTLITCNELAACTGSAGSGSQDLLAAAESRSISPICPEVIEVEGKLYLQNPIEDEDLP